MNGKKRGIGVGGNSSGSAEYKRRWVAVHSGALVIHKPLNGRDIYYFNQRLSKGKPFKVIIVD